MVIQHGDFSALAVHYKHRPGYSNLVLRAILSMHAKPVSEMEVADIGAGTGKLTEHLRELPFASLTAVEPNAAMREEGMKYVPSGVHWAAGSGEATGLPDRSVDWLLMGSSFHWVRPQLGLPEFHRVLRTGGFFTAVWNPRDLERSELESTIDRKIKELVPDLKRVSSGAPKSTQDWFQVLTQTGHFDEPILMEARHVEVMTPQRYLGVWQSVNDIQVQAGPGRWQAILSMIEHEIAGLKEVRVPYTTRAWTVKRVG